MFKVKSFESIMKTFVNAKAQLDAYTDFVRGKRTQAEEEMEHQKELASLYHGDIKRAKKAMTALDNLLGI